MKTIEEGKWHLGKREVWVREGVRTEERGEIKILLGLVFKLLKIALIVAVVVLVAGVVTGKIDLKRLK